MKTKSIAIIALLVLVGSLTSCKHLPARVQLKGGKAVAPIDNGTPATLEIGGTVTTLPVPAGSTVESVASVPASATSAAIPATVKVVLAGPSEMRSETHQERASSGAIDTKVATKRIEIEAAVAERKPLLWVALGCGVLGVLLLVVVKEWPALGKGFLAAGVVAGVAWKVSDVPSWAFLGVLVAVGLLIAGYKRAEWDKDGNGIPDVLEKQSRSG
jgi:hypothetical protein